jgi:uncharacterized membrane protein SpoIIM required for sporulation
MCFASGIFAGVGSLLFLAFNGIFLGLIFGYMLTVDRETSNHFFEFVSAHGPFELTGIALSGAAGLRMGLGMVATEGRSRLGGLQAAATQAMPILLVAAFLIAAAAPIEAWVSPSSLSLTTKRLVAGACSALLLIYFIILGRKGHHIQRAHQHAA